MPRPRLKGVLKAGLPQHREPTVQRNRPNPPSTMNDVAFYANIATLIAAPLGLAGLVVALWQLLAARRAASATTVVALNESFRQAWLHYVGVSDEDDEAKQYAFSDIMNLLELASAIDEDKLFVAKGGVLHRDYLLHVLKLIEQSDEARERMQKMFDSKDIHPRRRLFEASP